MAVEVSSCVGTTSFWLSLMVVFRRFPTLYIDLLVELEVSILYISANITVTMLVDSFCYIKTGCFQESRIRDPHHLRRGQD